MSDSTHQLFWEMRHFFTVSFTTFTDEEYLFSRNFREKREMRNSCRCKRMCLKEKIHFPQLPKQMQSISFLCQSPSRNGTGFVEHSWFRVKDGRMSANQFSQKLPKISQNVFWGALYLGDKVCFGSFFQAFVKTLMKESLQINFQRCCQKQPKHVLGYAVPSWKTLLWKVFQAFLKTLMKDSWEINFHRCWQKPAKTCFGVRCTFVKNSALEGFSSISQDIICRNQESAEISKVLS